MNTLRLLPTQKQECIDSREPGVLLVSTMIQLIHQMKHSSGHEK